MSRDGEAKRQTGRRVENVVAVAVLSLGVVLSSVSAWLGSYERAFWSAAVGFALFYGAGCFSIWYDIIRLKPRETSAPRLGSFTCTG
jgi:hypothetical protein